MASHRLSQPFGAALVLLAAAAPTLAQVPPSAGAVLRQLQTAPSANLPAPKAADDSGQVRPKLPPGKPVHVSGFRFDGNSLIKSDQLARLVQPFAGRDLQPDDLRQAADAVAREYRRQGWLARVFVPPQTVTGGVLLLRVIEGRFGQVEFSADTDVGTLRVKPDLIAARAAQGLTPDQPVSLPALERGVLLAGDLPGVRVIGSEEPGEREGETDLVIKAQNEPLVSGDVSVDNYGQAGVGSERVVGHADFNSPFGRGEQFDVLGIVTPDLQFGHGAVALPLGPPGLRLELSGALLHYQVEVPLYEDLRPRGDSDVLGATLEYQWVRATDHNLTVGVDLHRKALSNSDLGLTTSDYRVYDATGYLTGNLYDATLGGAVTSLDLSFGHGWVAMAGSPGEYWDRVGADTQGQFNVLRYRLDRTQQLPGRFAVYAALSGQLSLQNLDPAEMFYPGGPSAVGSSAVAADGGSSGELLDLELRWAGLRARGFQGTLKLRYDAAHIRIYANDEFAATPRPDSYSLQGVGAGALLDAPLNLHLSVMVEHRVGGDAGARVLDAGLTGARRDTRAWASLEMRF